MRLGPEFLVDDVEIIKLRTQMQVRSGERMQVQVLHHGRKVNDIALINYSGEGKRRICLGAESCPLRWCFCTQARAQRVMELRR